MIIPKKLYNGTVLIALLVTAIILERQSNAELSGVNVTRNNPERPRKRWLTEIDVNPRRMEVKAVEEGLMSDIKSGRFL